MFECLKTVLKFAGSAGLDEVNVVNVFTSLGLSSSMCSLTVK